MYKQTFEMEMCLCGRCAEVFYQSPDYWIGRTDPIQVIKDECSLCRLRTGYDYRIHKRTAIRQRATLPERGCYANY